MARPPASGQAVIRCRITSYNVCYTKLLRNGGKLEVRVRGPNVTPGYYKDPDLYARAIDADGFYRIGDAVKFADPDDPSKGLLFDGRVAEDFKLATGS